MAQQGTADFCRPGTKTLERRGGKKEEEEEN